MPIYFKMVNVFIPMAKAVIQAFLKFFLFFIFSIYYTYVCTYTILLTWCLHYINLHYLQYIYYNTITLIKFNYSWSIYIFVCMLIVWVTNKIFVWELHYIGY